MNREIKFRGKSVDNGEWVYGDLMHNAHRNERASILYVPRVIDFPDQICNVPIIKDTICQFTGLHDSDGKDIYEGDIIRVSEYENILTREFNDDPNRFDVFTLDEIKGDLQQSYTSPVVWEEGTFCISTKGDWLHHNDMFLAVLFGDMKRSSPIFIFEVIGNIHDNPELLKGGE